MREEFSSELPGRQAVYQQELQAWKEGDRRRVSRPGRKERGQEMGEWLLGREEWL